LGFEISSIAALRRHAILNLHVTIIQD